METNLKNMVTLAAIITTALSAGLFYAWAVSVIPGTRLVSDKSYIETMQQINRAIINPWFLAIFVGPLILSIWSTYLQFQQGMNMTFWLMVAGSTCYIVGTFGVTAFGNVPLNDALDLVLLDELSIEIIELTRNNYESQWNRFHMTRTVFSVISFILILIADRVAQNI